MAKEPIRTMQEVLDKAVEVTEQKELYELDCEIVKHFNLETLQGTLPQLMIVLQALRTATLAATELAVGDALTDEIDDFEEKEYDA